MSRSIKIRVVKESAKTVTIRMLSLNREMPVPKAEFEKRLESGMYEIVPLRTAPPPPPVEETTPVVDEAAPAAEDNDDAPAVEDNDDAPAEEDIPDAAKTSESVSEEE